MEQYDAFSAGVETGGLLHTAEIKSLICLLVRELDDPISSDAMRRVLTEQGIANYFDVSEALSDLLRSGSISEETDGDEFVLVLTPRGRMAMQELEGDIPLSVREKALAAALEETIRRRNAHQTRIDVEPSGEGYSVTFRIDAQPFGNLLGVTVYAADRQQVERMKTNFLKDPARFYSAILASLII